MVQGNNAAKIRAKEIALEPELGVTTLEELLHCLTMDSSHSEELGDVQLSIGWNALIYAPSDLERSQWFRDFPNLDVEHAASIPEHGGWIFQTDNFGFHYVETYASTEDLESAWNALREQEELIYGPRDDDYVIMQEGDNYLVGSYREGLGVVSLFPRSFPSEESAYGAALLDAERNSYFPNIWCLSEHFQALLVWDADKQALTSKSA